MAATAGVLIAIVLLWASVALYFYWTEDVRMSVVSPKSHSGYGEAIDRTFGVQDRFAKLWIGRLWPLPVACLLAALIVMVIAS
jgi:hypothetical protein